MLVFWSFIPRIGLDIIQDFAHKLHGEALIEDCHYILAYLYIAKSLIYVFFAITKTNKLYYYT